MICVAIADDHRIVRTALRTMLEGELFMKPVREYTGGRQLLEDPGLEQADVLLLDLNMPGIGGMRVLEDLQKRASSPAVLMLSVNSEETHALESIRRGAKGYLTKNCSREQLIEAITCAAHGGVFMTESLRKLLFEQTEGAQSAGIQGLSAREMEVFQALCSGASTKEIAFRLKISPNTVSTYKSRLMKKLQISSLAQLVRLGTEWGLN